MSNQITNILEFWVEIGLYDVFLPFIFIYTIVYAILQKTKILGSYPNIDAIVAFCFGFIATASLQAVEAVQMFFSAVGFIVVAGLCIMILVGLFGIKSVMSGKSWLHKLPRIFILVIIGLSMLYITSIALGFENFLVNLIPSLPSAVMTGVISGSAFVLIMWYIVSGKTTKPSSSSSSSSSKPKKDSKSSNESKESGNDKVKLQDHIDVGDESFEKEFST